MLLDEFLVFGLKRLGPFILRFLVNCQSRLWFRKPGLGLTLLAESLAAILGALLGLLQLFPVLWRLCSQLFWGPASPIQLEVLAAALPIAPWACLAASVDHATAIVDSIFLAASLGGGTASWGWKPAKTADLAIVPVDLANECDQFCWRVTCWLPPCPMTG